LGWLGLDDTDSLEGGCTTEVLHQLIQQLPPNVVVGQARLVRLWPFAKRRTRGNAAVAVELTTEDESELIDWLDNHWNKNVLPLAGRVQSSDHNEREQHPSDPGMVWFSKSVTNQSLYHRGLTQEITIDELPIADASWGGHGCIGATLAVHWPAETVTYEAIAWRKKECSGLRKLDEKAIKYIDQMGDTFLCRDSRLGTSLLAPKGESPVLFGIRTWTKESAEQALLTLANAENTEPVSGSIVFATNQGTNDHLSELFEVEIKAIRILKGGHTLIKSSSDTFLAFKQSGQISVTSQMLQPGDGIQCRGLRAHDDSIHIEFLRVVHLSPKKTRPMCPTCSKSMASMGAGQGIRCKKCGYQMEDTWDYVERSIPIDQWIQPPSSSRRHLAKPLDEASPKQNNL
jgi:tRNA(Ile2)-agmatinylcytidine synthase